MEDLAELYFVHPDFSLTPVLTNDFSLNHKNFYYIYMHLNSLLIVKNLTVWRRVLIEKEIYSKDMELH